MVQRKEVVDETVRRHIVQRKYALLEGDEGIRNLRQNQLRMTLKYLKDKIALNRKNRGNVSIMQSTIINQDLKLMMKTTTTKLICYRLKVLFQHTTKIKNEFSRRPKSSGKVELFSTLGHRKSTHCLIWPWKSFSRQVFATVTKNIFLDSFELWEKNQAFPGSSRKNTTNYPRKSQY